MIPLLRDARIERGARVLVRGSLNVPIAENHVRDAFRLEALLPTLEYLRDADAVTILIGHIGRSSGETLRPAYRWLAERTPAAFVPGGPTASEARKLIDDAAPGELIVLENLRRDPREEENNDAFAKLLAKLATIYVNDAFSASHRAHASIVGVPRLLPSYAGLRFEKELQCLSEAREPGSPSLCIIGGAKFETKEPLIAELVTRYDSVFIGGALANDFLRARGFAVGASKLSPRPVTKSLADNPRIVLPPDVIVESPAGVRIASSDAIGADDTVVDIGPQSVAMLSEKMAAAETVLWNGPMGYYEGGFTEHSVALAKALAASNARSYIGGGDTVAVLSAHGLLERFSFVSTAGGAMLDFLADGILPGITALENAPRT